MNHERNYPMILLGVVRRLEDDPDVLGRVRVRIPQFHGPVAVEADVNVARVEDENLPFAQVCYPIGLRDDKSESPTPFPLPLNYEVVFVTCPSGDYNYPLILGTTGNFSKTVVEGGTSQ